MPNRCLQPVLLRTGSIASEDTPGRLIAGGHFCLRRSAALSSFQSVLYATQQRTARTSYRRRETVRNFLPSVPFDHQHRPRWLLAANVCPATVLRARLLFLAYPWLSKQAGDGGTKLTATPIEFCPRRLYECWCRFVATAVLATMSWDLASSEQAIAGAHREFS